MVLRSKKKIVKYYIRAQHVSSYQVLYSITPTSTAAARKRGYEGDLYVIGCKTLNFYKKPSFRYEGFLHL